MTLEQAHKILHPDTSRDAIVEIREADMSKDNAIAEVEEACIIACMALDKQIPKMTLDDSVNDEGYERAIKVCPTCNNIYLCKWQEYCDKCGQKLDWNKTNG